MKSLSARRNSHLTTPVHPDPAPIELALFMEWPDRKSARAREAQWLAGRIARHLEKNGRDSQIAILLFSRTHLPMYLEALQQKRLPVQVKEGLKLLERPEVRCLWQLCRAIVLPQDDLAWSAQLRSPWFSLGFDLNPCRFVRRPSSLGRQNPSFFGKRRGSPLILAGPDQRLATCRPRTADRCCRIRMARTGRGKRCGFEVGEPGSKLLPPFSPDGQGGRAGRTGQHAGAARTDSAIRL